MLWLLIIPGVSLGVSMLMFGLCVSDLLDDRAKPRWTPRRSLDVLAYGVGFICSILTSLYPLITALMWL